VLAADAEADQSGRYVLLARMSAAALHRRLYAAEARRVSDDPGGAAGTVGGRRVGQLEADDRAEARIAHAGDGGVALEANRELLRRALGAT